MQNMHHLWLKFAEYYLLKLFAQHSMRCVRLKFNLYLASTTSDSGLEITYAILYDCVLFSGYRYCDLLSKHAASSCWGRPVGPRRPRGDARTHPMFGEDSMSNTLTRKLRSMCVFSGHRELLAKHEDFSCRSEPGRLQRDTRSEL